MTTVPNHFGCENDIILSIINMQYMLPSTSSSLLFTMPSEKKNMMMQSMNIINISPDSVTTYRG